jgi:hypothetical protein
MLRSMRTNPLPGDTRHSVPSPAVYAQIDAPLSPLLYTLAFAHRAWPCLPCYTPQAAGAGRSQR